MKSIRFEGANKRFQGSDCVDLFIKAGHDGENPTMTSVWELDSPDLHYLASSKLYIAVTIIGNKHPPIRIELVKKNADS